MNHHPMLATIDAMERALGPNATQKQGADLAFLATGGET
jgi:hypothetical protein